MGIYILPRGPTLTGEKLVSSGVYYVGFCGPLVTVMLGQVLLGLLRVMDAEDNHAQ